MSKLIDLDAALRSIVRPSMSLHLTTQSRAVTRGLQRLFRGQALDLTLIMARVGGGHAADLVASGLVARVLAGSYGAVSRHYTGPLRQIQQTYAQGQVSFQHWSFVSLTQRLAAAAQGLPFLPTHSLAGTSMARDNAPDYALVDDPSGKSGPIGVVSALAPDVSAVHAIAADEDGNTILIPPMEDAAWGAKACSAGAIVTAEHIVSRDFIRSHSHLVRIPARYVKAVCHVPYGAHPGVFGSPVLPMLGAYAEDEEFNRDYFAASRHADALATWLERWVYNIGSHDEYLRQLGEQRLGELSQQARGRTSPAQAVVEAPPRSTDEMGPTPTEITMVLALREVIDRVKASKVDLLLVGAGLSEVPATAARTLLRESGVEVTLVMGHGFYGFEPFPGHSEPDPSATLVTTDSSEIYGVFLGGRPGRTLAILGTAQVDRYGNLNSTRVGGRLLTGSGGSNDAASTCDTLVVTRLARNKLVEQVEYVTSPGTRVQAVVTERGVFEKDASTGRMVLTRYVPQVGQPVAATLDEISAACGWPLETSPGLQAMQPAELAELEVVRRLLPQRYAQVDTTGQPGEPVGLHAPARLP